MLLPLLLIGLATGAAAIIAYGTHPALAEKANGLQTIMLARQLEWPLILLSLLLCIALLALVISNKRRAWWLIGLAPVLALYIHRFAPLGHDRLYILESPQFVSPGPQTSPRDDAWVVGLVFQDQSYALPYSMLYTSPVVFITDYDKRMLLLWSARANRATAFRIARELKARDLEIVTTPADSVLIRDKRLGQYIVAATGLTVEGEHPVGLSQPVLTTRTTWGAWRKQHPATKVLQVYEAPNAPAGPIFPSVTGKQIEGLPGETRIAFIETTPPLGLMPSAVSKQPINTSAGMTKLLILRDPVTNRIRAFDRNVKEDLTPTFTLKTDRKHPEAIMADSDSSSLWAADGKAVDGPLHDAQMKEIPVEEDLYWGVMRYWYPGMKLMK